MNYPSGKQFHGEIDPRFEKLGVSSRVELVLYAVSNVKSVEPTAGQGEKRKRESAGKAKTEGRASRAAD
ncbi:MAG: hypothetical protein ABSE36_15140 [Terracidiphilus sp.]